MKLRVLHFLFLFWLSIVLVTACNGTNFVTSKTDPPALRVTYAQWPGFFPMEIAREKGFFGQQGVKVEPLYIANYLESISDFSAGRSDGIGTTLAGAINLAGSNPDLQVVLVTDESAGADALIVRGDIQHPADLKGKRLGVKLGDVGELFLITLLEQNHLTTDNVILVDVEGEKLPARFQSGDVQGGHTWQPFTERLAKAGAKVLFTSKQTPGLIPSIFVFRTQVIRDRPEQIKAFIRAWFQAQDYWKIHPEESKAIIAKKLNLKPEEISDEGVKLYNWQDNLKAFTPGSTTQSLYHTTKLYADFSIRTGGSSAALKIEQLMNPSFIRYLY